MSEYLISVLMGAALVWIVTAVIGFYFGYRAGRQTSCVITQDRSKTSLTIADHLEIEAGDRLILEKKRRRR